MVSKNKLLIQCEKAPHAHDQSNESSLSLATMHGFPGSKTFTNSKKENFCILELLCMALVSLLTDGCLCPFRQMVPAVEDVKGIIDVTYKLHCCLAIFELGKFKMFITVGERIDNTCP